jgi:hypothetical protein
MLTFSQLEDAGQRAAELYEQTERTILNDMARRISRNGNQMTATAEWQALRAKEINDMRHDIEAEMARIYRQNESNLIEIFDEAATRSLAADNELLKEYDLPVPLPPLRANNALQAILRAGIAKTLGEFQNLTRTTANTATKQFEGALDLAYNQVLSGGFTYQQAIKQAIKALSEQGLAVIEYPTGHRDYLDVAVRRATMTGVNQTVSLVQIDNGVQLGLDIVEVTAHAGARPDHAIWQGKRFSVSGRTKGYKSLAGGTGYGTGAGLCGWNCRHSFFPVLADSQPTNTARQINDLNHKTVRYNGQIMDIYTATQQQRHIERNIRKFKRESDALSAGGLDNTHERDKVTQWQAVQRDFVKQTGLKRQYFRERAGAQLKQGVL